MSLNANEQAEDLDTSEENHRRRKIDVFQSFEDYDYRETEEYKRHERAIRKFREMSDDEKLQTFIDAGIYNENWELTRKYGGEAPNVDEDDE